MNRWSIVREMKVNALSLASILQIGDNKLIQPVSKVLAVQREVPEFKGNEGNYNDYPIFSREIPLPPVNETICMSIDNSCSRIQVGGIIIVGVSSSSVIQVGTNRSMQTESRIKHIRHFIRDASIKNLQKKSLPHKQ